MDAKSQTRERKKAEFSEPSRRKSKSTVTLIAVLLLLVGAGIYLVINASSENPTSTPVATNTPQIAASGSPEAGDIRISLADLSSTAKFFDYRLSDNKPIRF